MVNVTRSNFLEQCSDLLRHLPTASFVAIDEEMTGISLPGSGRPKKDDSPERRYQRLRAVPERYAILQLGVSLFHENPAYHRRGKVARDAVARLPCGDDANGGGGDDGDDAEHDFVAREGALDEDELEEATERAEHQRRRALSHDCSSGGGDDRRHGDDSGPIPEFFVRTYNFHLFPPTAGNGEHVREVTLNPSTVAFLNEHGMDFGRVAREGIPYVTGLRAEYLLDKFREKHRKEEEEEREAEKKKRESASSMGDVGRTRKRIELTRPEDIAFVARTMAELREWIDGAPRRTRRDQGGGDDGDDDGDEDAIGGNNSDPEGSSHLLPPCNSFLRRCLYETIEMEYPTLLLERAPGSPSQILVLRLSPEEKRRRRERLKREEHERLRLDQIGAYAVFKALSDACRGELAHTPSATNGEEKCSDNARGFKAEKVVHDGDYDNENDELVATSSTDTPITEHVSSCGGVSSVSSLARAKQGRRRVPIVVHNGLMDLLFLLTHFHNHTLPDTLAEAKALIRRYFPVVYDTKILSTECSESDIANDSTVLGDLFKKIHAEEAAAIETAVDGEEEVGGAPVGEGVGPSTLRVVNNKQGEAQEEQLHEASYDAYMTGAVFRSLCQRILEQVHHQRQWGSGDDSSFDRRLDRVLHGCGSWEVGGNEDVTRLLFGRNKLFLMQNLYTIDLEGIGKIPDPLSRGMSDDTTYRVSGIDASVSTRDILQALVNVVDDEPDEGSEMALGGRTGRQVGYEIVWVDDTTFMVATRCDRPDGDVLLQSNSNDAAKATLQRHGLLILAALRRNFPNLSVVSLRDHLEAIRAESEAEAKTTEAEVDIERHQTASGSVLGVWTDIVSNVMGALGMRRRRTRECNASDDDEKVSGSRSNKKRRVDNE